MICLSLRARRGYLPDRTNGVPAHRRRECGLRGRTAGKREETTSVSSLLSIPLFPFRARCARKGKCRFPVAARLLMRQAWYGCHPRGSPLPRGVESALLVALGKWAVNILALRTLRAKRALICGSKCRKSWTNILAPAHTEKGKGVIRERGETLVSPLLCARRA